MSVDGLPFNLLRSFAVLSILCVSIITLVPAFFLTQVVESNMLRRDAIVTRQFVVGILDTMPSGVYDEHNATYRNHSTYEGYFHPDSHYTESIFAALDLHLQSLPDIVRTSVYARDGTRIWCTNPRQIGIRNLANKKLAKALAGELAVGPDVVVWAMNRAERARVPPGRQRFSEMYMPIWNHQQDTVVGVVEVYKASAPLFLAITHGKRMVWGVAIVSGLIIYSILLGIMHRATRIIRGQRKDLIESESLAIVGELASAIAENVRGLLTSLRSSTEVVMEKDPAPSVQSHAGDVVVELSRLERLFHSLRTYARPIMPTPTPMQLRPVVDEVAQECATVLEKQGVQFELSVRPKLPLVLAEPTSLQQVLNTVIANAQDAMPNGGTLSIEVAGAKDQSHVVIEIRDSGCGMTPDQLAKVFQPFSSNKPRGLGIGLTLAKRIMDRQGSTITLSSTVGCGTTVTLSLAVP